MVPVNQVEPTRKLEYERWLIRVESYSMLPLKLLILAVSVFYWLWRDHFVPPSTPVFITFIIYGMLTLDKAYFFWRDRIATHQARQLVLISYLIDLAFVTILVFRSLTEYDDALKFFMLGDFHLFYLVMVLRGFALFQTTVETISIAVFMTACFIASLFLYVNKAEILPTAGSIGGLGLIWFVLLATMWVVNLITKQQAEAIRVRERLIKIEGLANLGELTAGVAHEINNPIGIIKAYAEFLKKSSSKDDSHYDDYETIRAEAERCETIVRRMLDFASPDVRELKVIELKPFLEEICQTVFNERMEEEIKFTFECEDRLPKVNIDAVQIRQAILNVLLNARQIVEKLHEGPKEVTLTAAQQKGPRAPIEIKIHNSGPSIDEEDAKKAFEPFYTKREGGSGLGLAITRRIIEAHEGEITIWPAEVGGTVCSITIPIFEDD